MGKPGARVLRGFFRLGIGAAVLTGLIGLAITVSVVVNDYNHWNDGPPPPPGFVLDPISSGTICKRERDSNKCKQRRQEVQTEIGR